MTHTTEQEQIAMNADRALMVRSLNEWVMETGAVVLNSSWHSELQSIVEMAFDKGADLQAARRAPSVPVPLRKPTIDQVADAVGYHDSAWDCVDPSELIDAILMLAAAPQPPEADHIPDAGKMVAAPVQLPEPVAYLHECGKKPSLRTLEFSKVTIQLSAKGYKSLPLYTEQQVRQLLANHGIQEQST